jgi:hypothetical protein
VAGLNSTPGQSDLSSRNQVLYSLKRRIANAGYLHHVLDAIKGPMGLSMVDDALGKRRANAR